MSLDEAFNWAIKMHPNELQGLTNGAVNPIGDLKTGAWQTAKQKITNTKETINGLRDLYRVTRPNFLGRGWPFIMPPDSLMKELEIEKREYFTQKP